MVGQLLCVLARRFSTEDSNAAVLGKECTANLAPSKDALPRGLPVAVSGNLLLWPQASYCGCCDLTWTTSAVSAASSSLGAQIGRACRWILRFLENRVTASSSCCYTNVDRFLEESGYLRSCQAWHSGHDTSGVKTRYDLDNLLRWCSQ